MARNISFALTVPQFKARTKTVTRRMGWLHAKPGDLLMGCEKCQGLQPGEQIVRLGLIRLVDVRREHLDRLNEFRYGREELAREGFPGGNASWFIGMFCKSHKGCEPGSMITRLEYGYVDIKSVYCFPNGMAMVFDQRGTQIAELQGRTDEMMPEIIKAGWRGETVVGQEADRAWRGM